MSCPHREPCAQCKEIERSSHRFFAWLCAVCAPLVGMIAVDLALELDPRAPGWTGIAIGCVFMWFYNSTESRRIA